MVPELAKPEPVHATDSCCAATFPPPPWEETEEGRGERRDPAENRRRVLEVARDLFAERGVDHVSMHEIARAAGIGQGTLYRRYAHKGLVCMALLDRASFGHRPPWLQRAFLVPTIRQRRRFAVNRAAT